MNSQLNTAQRQLFRLSIGVILALCILIAIQFLKADSSHDVEKLQNYFSEKSIAISNQLLNENNYFNLDEFQTESYYEDWKISVFEKDQLVWWKDPSIYNIIIGEKRKYYYHTAKKNDKKVTLQFPITSTINNQVQRKYLEDASCRDVWEITLDGNETLDTGKQNSTSLKSTGKLKSLNLLRIQSLLYILLFLLVFLYLFHLFEFDSYLSLFAFGSIIISFRLASIYFDLFSGIAPLNIGSHIFHVSPLSPGIGDLFINGLLSIFLASALSKFIDHKIAEPTSKNSKLITSVASSLIGLSTLIFIVFIKKWVGATYDLFEIEKVFNTSATGILNLWSILLLSCGLFTFHLAIYKSLFNSHKTFAQRLVVIAIVLFVTIVATKIMGLPLNPFYLSLGFASYLILIDLFLDNRSLNITWLLCWIIVISAFLSIFIFKHVNDHKLQLRQKALSSYFHEEDLDQNRWIVDTIKKLGPKIKSNLDSLSLNNEKLNEEKIVSSFYLIDSAVARSEFISDYHLSILDTSNNHIFKTSLWHDASLKRRLATAQLVSTNLLFDPIDNSYIYKFGNDMASLNEITYQFYLSFQSKNRSLLSFPYSFGTSDKEFSYAIYRDNQFLYSNKDPQLYTSNLNLGTSGNALIASRQSTSDNELFYKYNEHITIASFEEVSDLIKPISLFSYIFSLLGFLLVILTLLNNYSTFLPRDFTLHVDSNSLRDKIQLSVVSLIIISFIAIAIVTAYYFKRISEGYSDTILSDKVSSVVNDSQLMKIKNAYQIEEHNLINVISNMSLVHRSDILLYDKTGELVSSGSKENNVQRRLPFDVHASLNREVDRLELLSSKISRLKEVKTAYKAITHNKKILGFVQVLYPSNINTSIELDDFLGTLLNVYVFLFILAGGLAIAVANSVTHPLSRLGEKLRQFSLGRKNEPLGWENKGEIGALIHEYNQLILKLEESANFIAKTERDSAWREMAKQVAHEIKNPLTSMKLSIQHLQRAIGHDPENAKDLIERVSSTLIEQITNLSQIASEFSNFGQLPQAQNETLIMNEIVSAIHDLFRKRDDMDISLTVPIDEIYVFADKNHLIRILNNLVKNAIQAIPLNRRGKIQLSLYKDDDYAYIKVKDNGTGIPEAMYEKVFTPNFTTKSSGTGLGLAIAANMIEAFNGKIYFETEVDKGTAFFVRIPLMRLEDNFKFENKVNLD